MGKKSFFEPISGFELPRFAGMPTFMRLPHVDLNHDKIWTISQKYHRLIDVEVLVNFLNFHFIC